MLKTNSKIVNEKIRAFLMDHFKDYYNEQSDYLPAIDTDDYTSVCNAIIHNFYTEKVKFDCGYRAHRYNLFTLFVDWVSGLCSAIDSAYYYNVSAVDLLGAWLEETDAEKARYTEAQAEELITKLLWREITKRADMSIF